MKGETLLTRNNLIDIKDFIADNEPGTCIQDQVLDEFCWALERVYEKNFRNYGNIGISAPTLNYTSPYYGLLDNFRTIYDLDQKEGIFAYAYFDYPISHSPLYISIVDAENFNPHQLYNALGEVIETYGGAYKTTKQNYYPFTIKLSLNNQVKKQKSIRVDTLAYAYKLAGYRPSFLDNYRDFLMGLYESPHELFDVVDTQELDMNELNRFMKNYLKDLNSLK
ncbi:MAG TPA: hypothetical protein VEC16_02070 [Alphaproteobacteria bacterium]|nr:hypothetical protein [Alphaproteobacteria bacterium]